MLQYTSSMKKQKTKKPIPYAFVFDYLEAVQPYTKAMFGCTAIYVGEKIVLILRDRADYKPDNGVWLATIQEHHSSLKKDFPSMRSLEMFGAGPTGWQVLSKDAGDFEESLIKVCKLLCKNDPRIVNQFMHQNTMCT